MIDITRRAQDFLDRLQPKQFKQVAGRILALTRDPFPHDCKHLSGHPGFRRLDVGEFRVCYEFTSGTVRVAVVGQRNDDAVYRELRRAEG